MATKKKPEGCSCCFMQSEQDHTLTALESLLECERFGQLIVGELILADAALGKRIRKIERKVGLHGNKKV